MAVRRAAPIIALMPARSHGTIQPPRRRTSTLGVVSFLNARPLVAGLDERDDLTLLHAVPSALPDLLHRGEVDVALIPVVDLWRSGNRLSIVSDACIATDAETLTVRVFSRVPPDRIERLHVDTDSHTSVLLAQVLWREMYGRTLDCRRVTSAPPTDDVDAVLLIGDKVVTQPPRGCGFEVDLTGAWRHLTGLPFVFAVWAGRADQDHAALAAELSAARDRGVARAAQLAERFGPEHGWPVSLARRYLCETLSYRLTPSHLAGMERFRQFVRSRELL